MEGADESVQRWAEFWNAAVQQRETVTDEIQAARWNEMAEGFGRNMDGERKERRMADLLSVLREAGFSPEGVTVLDIGCGPGALSIPLARAGATVTSLDIATGMLDRLRGTAKDEKLDITPIECSWWSADIDKLGFRNAFDLVIASSTPAIKDAETFERMMACSKKYCYYNGFIGGNPRTAPERKSLAEVLGFEERKGHAFGPGGRARGGLGILFPFMYLYMQGIRPDIRFNRTARPEQDWDEAAGKAIERFSRTRELSPEQKETVRNYYKEIAVDGKIRHEPGALSAMMVWSVQN
ncbi:MAG: methyltransferase domain-containing protein [Methanomicrobiales archaeon]|nr:methyltransferase domain-containing protein [Methanomicrobiales archaeon]